MKGRVLLTGGAGFIGSYIAERLLLAGYSVRVLDALIPQVHPTGEWPTYLSPEVERVRADVRDADAVRRALADVDVVSHHAARVGVGQSQYEIEGYVDGNMRGTATLLDVLVNSRHRVRRLVVAASMSSYGEGAYRCASCGIVRPGLRNLEQMQAKHWEPPCPRCRGALTPVPTDETQECQSNSIYALSKKSQEDMVLMIGQTYDIPAIALRYFNVFGPRQSLQNPYTGVAAIFLSRILSGNRPVVYEDGAQARDFVSVHDIAEVNLRAIESTVCGAVNVGTGQPHGIADIARTLAKLVGKDIEPEISGGYRKGDVRHCYADNRRLREWLQYTPEWSFERAMAELIEWSRGAAVEDRFEQATRELRERGLA